MRRELVVSFHHDSKPPRADLSVITMEENGRAISVTSFEVDLGSPTDVSQLDDDLFFAEILTGRLFDGVCALKEAAQEEKVTEEVTHSDVDGWTRRRVAHQTD
jgi:hypothetical protein